MGSQFWLWLDTIVMVIGGGAILMIGKRRTAKEEGHTIFHGIVPIIAACSYFAMAVGQGSLYLPLGTAAGTGRLFYFARYIDWSFTTPLLLLTLAMTAQHSVVRRPSAVAGLMLADLMMILTALFFGLSTVDWIKWTWFSISCVAFLAVYYVIWVTLKQESVLEREDVQQAFRRNAMILSVVWLIYPIILFFSTDGLGVFDSATSVACIAILDLIAKVVYGLMTVTTHSKIVDRDLAEHSSPGLRRAA